jgi:hypothetical protein
MDYFYSRCDTPNGSFLLPIASLTQQGITQLNSNVNSTRIDQASTPFAVNKAYTTVIACSNDLYPMGTFGSNTSVWSCNAIIACSNDLYPMGTFGSNTSVWSCNAIIACSNDLYPMARFGSNEAGAAMTRANEAMTAAEEAQATADTAAGEATAAGLAAAAAQATADTALLSAGGAATAAAGAAATAGTALSTANSAFSKAEWTSNALTTPEYNTALQLAIWDSNNFVNYATVSDLDALDSTVEDLGDLYAVTSNAAWLAGDKAVEAEGYALTALGKAEWSSNQIHILSNNVDDLGLQVQITSNAAWTAIADAADAMNEATSAMGKATWCSNNLPLVTGTSGTDGIYASNAIPPLSNVAYSAQVLATWDSNNFANYATSNTTYTSINWVNTVSAWNSNNVVSLSNYTYSNAPTPSGWQVRTNLAYTYSNVTVASSNNYNCELAVNGTALVQRMVIDRTMASYVGVSDTIGSQLATLSPALFFGVLSNSSFPTTVTDLQWRNCTGAGCSNLTNNGVAVNGVSLSNDAATISIPSGVYQYRLYLNCDTNSGTVSRWVAMYIQSWDGASWTNLHANENFQLLTMNTTLIHTGAFDTRWWAGSSSTSVKFNIQHNATGSNIAFTANDRVWSGLSLQRLPG